MYVSLCASLCGQTVGDLHGDLDKAKYALQLAGVLSSDEQNLWVGGQTVCMWLAPFAITKSL